MTTSNAPALAVDLGGSGGKIAAGELIDGRAAFEVVHRFDNKIVMVEGKAYWDFLRIFDEIKTGIKAAFSKYGKISSIGVDSWCNDYFLLTKNGTILESPRNYRDARTQGWIERAYGLMPKAEVYRRAGQQFARFETAYQLLAQKEQDPDILSIAEDLVFFPDYLTHLLGAKKYAEYTVSGVTNLFNITKGDWDDDILAAYGIPRSLFQPIVYAGDKVGGLSPEIQKELDITDADLYAVGSHDTASAVAAVPCTDDDFIYISSGTWSLVGAELKKPILTEESMEAGFGNESGVEGTIRYIRNVMGLWIIQECSRVWKSRGMVCDFAELARGASLADNVEDIFIDPDDGRLFEPANMPEVVNEILAEKGFKPKDEFETVRIITQSLACKYRYVIDLIEKLTGKSYENLYVIGGGSGNVLLNELTSGFTGKKVYAGPSEATAMGNIFMQWIGSGLIKDLKQARQICYASAGLKTYEPADRDKYERLYKKFLNDTGPAINRQ